MSKLTKCYSVLFVALLFVLVPLLFSCSKSSSQKDSGEKEDQSEIASSSYSSEEGEDSEDYSEDDEDDDEYSDNDSEDSENIEDGTHTATVDYYNPKTGYSKTYTLDVDVEDGQVSEIDFPNGGYLDDSRISSDNIEDGNCTVEDDEGRTYDVQLDD